MSIELKPHNIETYEKINNELEQSKKVAVIQPPGTGKTYLALKLLEENKGKKAVYVAPSNSILHNLKRTIFDSGMNMTDFPDLTRITYAKLMRMSEEEISQLGADIIILDEFHHCGAPEWGNGVNRLLEKNPESIVLGLSATPIRYLDNGRDMAEELFGGNVASEMSLEEAIDRGILPEATYVSALYSYNDQLQQMQEEINNIPDGNMRSEAQTLFQELKGSLDENTQQLPELLSQYITNKSGKYIVFCKTIEDMKAKQEAAQEMFSSVNPNITTYAVHSKIRENNKILSKFEQADDDSLKLMFAVDMLNEGYHIKDLDGVVMMRPTFSPTIFEQQIGRALSVKSNSGNPPVILDLVNNFDSCKIIEDFCERMKQYGKGTGKKHVSTKSRLTIFDKTKQFREIASKITDLCKKRWLTIDEKIDVFTRFLETGEELSGETVFEGQPIGQWGMLIRSQVNTNKLNLTDDQLEKLSTLGILERRIDSTIDEKIQKLVEWNRKYPKAQMVGIRAKKENIIRSYSNSEDEYQELMEEYLRMQKYYDYIRTRKSQRKLTPEQEEICREGNVRGVFGNPTKIVEETKELVKKYRINEEKIKYILDKYSSMQNFIKAFREGTLDKEDEKVFENNLNMYLDINGGTNRRYTNLLREMDNCWLKTKTKTIDKELTIFDIGKIQKYFLENTSRKMDIVAKNFGIGPYEHEEEKSAKELAEFYGTTTTYMYSQIRFGVRKLRESKYFGECIEYKSIPARANLETIEKYTQYEKERIGKIHDTIFDSNLIFYPDEEFVQEPNSMTSQEVSELLSELSSISKYADIRENITERDKYEYSEEQTRIEVLGLSHKIYYGLKRNGIHTIGQLRDFDKGELLTNLLDGNEECLSEIETALKDNQSLREEREEEREKEKEQERARKQLIDNNNKIGIEELDLSIRAFNCLKMAKINTVEDLVKLSKDELMRIRNMGRKSLEEILLKIEMLPDSIADLKDNQFLREEREKEKEQERVRKQLIDNNNKIGIEELDLSIRAFNCLKMAKINTVEDLVKLSEDELMRIRNMGRKSLEEILLKIEMLPEIIGDYKRGARPYLKPYVEKKDFYVEPEMVSTTDFEFDEEDEIIQIEFDEEPETINTEEEELEESKQQMTEEPESVQEENEVEEEDPEITEIELEKLKATRDSLEQEIEQIRAKVLEAEKLLASYNALLNGKDLDKKVPTEPRGE